MKCNDMFFALNVQISKPNFIALDFMFKNRKSKKIQMGENDPMFENLAC